MKTYVAPNIDFLQFDENEEVVMVSYTYSAKQLNEYMFNERDVDSTATLNIEQIKVVNITEDSAQ